jgi:hypothetical protein
MAAGKSRSHHRITVASLCCDADEANSAFPAWIKDHQSYGLKASSTSHAAPTRATCYRLECRGLAATLSLPLSVHSEYRNGFGLATQTFLSSHLDTTKALGSAYDVIGPRSVTVPPSSTPLTTAGRGQVLHTCHDVNLRVQHPTQIAFTESSQRVPRLPRPSYTDEQRSFIMYYRIIGELSWPEIESEFASFFNLRTKDGLTSVYYRIRKTWAMNKVSDTDTSSMSDRSIVESKSSRFTR